MKTNLNNIKRKRRSQNLQQNYNATDVRFIH